VDNSSKRRSPQVGKVIKCKIQVDIIKIGLITGEQSVINPIFFYFIKR
jgi:hypothetical protein